MGGDAARRSVKSAPEARLPAACVCVLATGRPIYYLAARGAVRSVLEHSDFEVFVAVGDPQRWRAPSSPRVTTRTVADLPRRQGRATPFLRKLHALAACLVASRAERIVLLDADARFVRRIDAAAVDAALDGRTLGMSEQPTIRGSGMTRAEFLRHYARHSLVALGDGAAAPSLEDFRFFNSGVLLARRDGLEQFLAWALPRIDAPGTTHQVGSHMIADQDYLQVWSNTVRPGSCATLPWSWNHCEHWDEGYPRAGARILHASNFCRGPSLLGLLRLEARLALSRLRRVNRGPDGVKPASPEKRWTSTSSS